MCIDKMVDVDTADKSTLQVTDGRTWSTKGTILTFREIINFHAYLLYK